VLPVKNKLVRVLKTVKVLENLKVSDIEKEMVVHEVCWRKRESPVRVFVVSKITVNFVQISITLDF